MPTFKTQGIILKHEAFREYDKIFTIYTHHWGKVRSIAPGVRKIHSKQAGHLEPLTLAQFMFALGRTQRLKLATSVALQNFEGIKSSLFSLALAMQCLEITEKAVPEAQQDAWVFSLLQEFLECVQKNSVVDQNIAIFTLQAYGLKLLSHLGYRPELFTCLGCGRKIEEGEVFFNALQGGLIQGQCLVREPVSTSSVAVDRKMIACMHTMLSAPLSTLWNQIFAEAFPLSRVNAIISSFIETHLEQPLLSTRFLTFSLHHL